MGTESEERPQWLVYYRAEYKTGGIYMKRRKSGDLKLHCLLQMPTWFSDKLVWWVYRESMLELGAEIEEEGKTITIAPPEMVQGEGGTLGVVLQRWGWCYGLNLEKRKECWQLGYLLLCLEWSFDHYLMLSWVKGWDKEISRHKKTLMGRSVFFTWDEYGEGGKAPANVLLKNWGYDWESWSAEEEGEVKSCN